MATPAPVSPCRFSWEIWNAFVPCRRLAAVFYHGSPSLTAWTVALNPIDHHLDNWTFTISLHGAKSGDRINEDIVVERIRIRTSIRRTGMDSKEEVNYRFCAGNRHTYQFQTLVRSPPLFRAPCLTIEVEILFPRQNIASREGLYFHNMDLMQLSMDFDRLLPLGRYCDLNLQTRSKVFSVHSCMLRVRCGEFLEVHAADIARGDTVETNISDNDLLWFILTYLYSGKLLADTDDPPTEIYLTALFQVMDKYKMHHLYKNFAIDYSRQKRTTRRNRVSNTSSFPLNDRVGQPLDNPSYEWSVNPNSKCDFTFIIKFFLDAGDPWFMYSLQSKTPVEPVDDPERFIIHAQVNVRLLHRSSFGMDPDKRSVHERAYRVRSYGCVESGTCHFEGDHPEFDDFLKRNGSANSQNFAECILCFSDGSILTSVDSDFEGDPPDNLDRFNVLSDHMSELLTEDTEKDLRLVCWPGREEVDTFNLHKAIFAARVRRWRHVIEENPEGDDIPDLVTCRLRTEAFAHILDYIYSGKLFPIPNRFLDDVRGFAVLSGMWSLEKLVDTMC